MEELIGDREHLLARRLQCSACDIGSFPKMVVNMDSRLKLRRLIQPRR